MVSNAADKSYNINNVPLPLYLCEPYRQTVNIAKTFSINLNTYGKLETG